MFFFRTSTSTSSNQPTNCGYSILSISILFNLHSKSVYKFFTLIGVIRTSTAQPMKGEHKIRTFYIDNYNTVIPQHSAARSDRKTIAPVLVSTITVGQLCQSLHRIPPSSSCDHVKQTEFKLPFCRLCIVCHYFVFKFYLDLKNKDQHYF